MIKSKGHNYSLNKYDYILIITIISLSYGNYELLGALTPIRIIGFIAIPTILKNIKILYHSIFRPWLILIVIWWVYMVISLIWTPGFDMGIIYIFHITLMMSCFLLICISALKSSSCISSISIGWILMCLTTFPVAIWELATGNHLSSGAFNEGAVLGSSYRIFAAVTFLNLNSYVVILCCALPFVCSVFFNERMNTFFFKSLALFCLIIISVILLMNASRGGLICLAIATILMFVFLYRKMNLWKRVVFSMFILMFIYVAINNFEELFLLDSIMKRLEGKDSLIEDNNRTKLIRDGLNIAINMYFLGGGVSSMVPLYQKYTSNTIHYAHNFYVEFLLEYGLVLSFSFFILFYKFLLKKKKRGYFHHKFLFTYSLISSFFLFAIDDGYLYRSGVWIYIACLIAISGLLAKINDKRLESHL